MGPADRTLFLRVWHRTQRVLPGLLPELLPELRNAYPQKINCAKEPGGASIHFTQLKLSAMGRRGGVAP